jgi:hypothetical protein
VVKRLPEQVLPDFAALHAELQQHPQRVCADYAKASVRKDAASRGG